MVCYSEISKSDVNYALFHCFVANSFQLYYTTFNLQVDCGYFNVTIIRTGTSALPIELILSLSNVTSRSWNFSIIFQPMQSIISVVVPIIEAPEKSDNGFSLTLSVGATSESLTRRLLFGASRSLSPLATMRDDNIGTTLVAASRSANLFYEFTLLFTLTGQFLFFVA